MSKYSTQFQMYADAVKNELEVAYEQGRADERERIVEELENLSDNFFQKVAVDIIDIAIKIVRGK